VAAPSGKAPARLIPLLYLGTAHISLALACLLAALWPRAVAGFFYHSWMVALVHLVTIGWITFSILGAIYIVGPLALRMDMRPGRMDGVAYAFALIGLVGMVSHFWIQEYGGMAWSAGTVAIGVWFMTARIAYGIRRAGAQPAVKLHITLACVNFWIAASMGLLIAIDKASPFLPGFVLANVFAHAHLAALGWATLMVMGVGYRLLPMIFPAKMPVGRSTYASAVVFEIGVLGLFASLLLQSDWAMAFGIVIVAGLALFAGHVIWMLRHPAPKPAGLPRPDFAVLHAAGAGASLLAAAAIGLLLLAAPPSTRMLQAAAAYGALGLVGFLAQMVVAMEARLLPMVAWFWAYDAAGYEVPPPSPHTMRDRLLQSIVFAAWTAGVPSLASGLFLESAPLVAVGAWSLFVGVSIGTLDSGLVVGSAIRAGRRRSRAAA
jgi:hypothetical protein